VRCQAHVAGDRAASERAGITKGQGGVKVWVLSGTKPTSFASAEFFPCIQINQHQMTGINNGDFLNWRAFRLVWLR